MLIDSVVFKSGRGGTDDYVPSELVLMELRKLCGNCPACILATVRALHDDPEDPICSDGGFTWKTEREWWLDDLRNASYFSPDGESRFEREEWDRLREKRFAINPI